MNKTILSLFLLAAVPAFVLAGPDARPDKEPGSKAAVEGQRCDGRPRFGEVRKEHPDWKFCPTCGRPMNPQGFQKDKPKAKGDGEVRREKPRREGGDGEVRREKPRREGGDGEVRREKPRREGGDGEVRREKPRKDRGEKPMKKAPKKDAPVAAEDVAED